MHVRISRVRRGTKTHEYTQLVESYRREGDGMPVHRVIANLGKLNPVEVGNLKRALEASRKGKTVVIARPPKPAAANALMKPQDNLRYLDIAVLLDLWRHWGLRDLLDELLPAGGSDVPAADVIAALTLQRCVDPGSKLYAQRWFPRTALPELLSISPKSFNNTRLHRVLEDLDEVTPALMRRLPRKYNEQEGAFASLFLDVTDTWFAGDGPDLAQRSKTKEGLVLQKIGIVLVCNEHGYPLRWQTIPGTRNDGKAMRDMLRSIQGLSWIGDAPVVCDRAMGNTARIREMLATGIRFLTALTRIEFGSYTDRIPHQPFADLNPGSLESNEHTSQVARLAESVGMRKVSDDMFVLDLGVIERPDEKQPEPNFSDVENSEVDKKAEAMRLGRAIKAAVDDGRADSYLAAGRVLRLRDHQTSAFVQLCRLPEDIQQEILSGGATEASMGDLRRIARMDGFEEQRREFSGLVQRVDKTVEAMSLGRAIKEAVDSGRASSLGRAGEALGLKPSVTSKYRQLCRLRHDVQQEVLDGKASGLRLDDLIDVSAVKESDKQRQAFIQRVADAALRGGVKPKEAVRKTRIDPAPSHEPVRVRAVVFFNPEMFVNKRERAQRHLEDIANFVERLNEKLSHPHRKPTAARIIADVEKKLRSYDLVDAFEIRIASKDVDGRSRFSVQLELKTKQWARRRRYDGFCLLAGHPDLPHSADELCRLYRAKDMVEKDFGVIKSVMKLRPVRHRTDAKVRAHVTLCMLALLLERTLRRSLGGTCTAGAALELLSDRCLNRYRLLNGSSAYAMTQTTAEHDAILRTLKLQHLANDQEIADRIVAR